MPAINTPKKDMAYASNNGESNDTFAARRMQLAASERWAIGNPAAPLKDHSATSRTSNTETTWEDSISSFNNSAIYSCSSANFGLASIEETESDKWELDYRLKKELQSKLRGKIRLKIQKKRRGQWPFHRGDLKGLKVVKTNGVVDKKPLLREMIGAFRNHLPQLAVQQPRKGNLTSKAA